MSVFTDFTFSLRKKGRLVRYVKTEIYNIFALSILCLGVGGFRSLLGLFFGYFSAGFLSIAALSTTPFVVGILPLVFWFLYY